jgi:hypothetical protein
MAILTLEVQLSLNVYDNGDIEGLDVDGMDIGFGYSIF